MLINSNSKKCRILGRIKKAGAKKVNRPTLWTYGTDIAHRFGISEHMSSIGKRRSGWKR
jgi:hypothetical protein